MAVTDNASRGGAPYGFKNVDLAGRPDTSKHGKPGRLSVHANSDSWLYAAYYLALATCDDRVDFPCTHCMEIAADAVRGHVKIFGGYDPLERTTKVRGAASGDFFIPG